MEARALNKNSMLRGFIVPTFLAAFCIGCARSDSVQPPDDTRLSVGGWGGEDAGVIVEDTVTHVHVGCTFGDFIAPVPLDASKRFSVSGSYILRAYPVQVGPPLPAQLSGVVEGDRLTFSIAVNDTVEKKVVSLGPMTVRYAQAANMRICPICRRDQSGASRPM